ncbi:MAG: hypothetical protein ACK2T5_03835, partial [Anaerolineales bacterium]
IRRFSRDHRMIWVRDNGVMDVSHEALMRNWDRLSRWLIENREAGKAYLELAHKYEKWKRSSRHQSLFLSWFKRKNGLAGSEMVEHLKPLLTVRTRKGYKASPRYNRFWAQRFLDYGIQPGGGAGEQIDKDEAALLDSNYRNQFKYLKVSIWKENFKRVGWPLGFFIFFLLSLTLGTLSFELYENQRQIIASNLWNQLEGWEPVIKQEYVNGLWQVSMSENSVLTQFVKQIPEGSHIKQLGFRPQPIARAIGWRWSPELRKIALNFLKAEVEKTSIEDKFTLASLASMVAVLGDYIPPELQERAIDRFRQYIGETEPSSLKVWTSARILACLEDKLDASSSSFSDTIIQHIFKSSDKLIAASSGWPLGQIAAGLTSAAWFIKDVQKKALSDDELSTIRNMTDKIISHLENNQDDFLSFMLARPLVSLISVLPSMDQAQLLVRMFRTVSNWPERTNPDLLLIFAQAFDRAGDQIRKSGGNHGYEGLSVIVSETAHKIDGNLILRPSHKIEMLRLAVPIAVAGDDAGAFYESATKALDPRTDLAAKMAQAKEGERSDPETEARMHFTDEELLPLGLSGRLFSILAEADQLPDSIDPNVVMSNITEALKNINMMAAVNTNDTQNFAREGLAHAISALALNPRLDEIQNQQALEYAKDALARTGSAEEAATWATAIVNLLKDEQINEFVEAIANLIKYPTAALTAREPNAREPKNATDIFILSLIRRPELKQVLADTSFQPQLAHQREILAKIIADERFSDIRLKAPPIDPRR